jgi:uncharacterized membrane protein YphA (DoxX/SURF4 family)
VSAITFRQISSGSITPCEAKLTTFLATVSTTGSEPRMFKIVQAFCETLHLCAQSRRDQMMRPLFWAWPAMAAEVLLGITLILGIATRYASLFAFVYLIITVALAHRYWEYPAAQMANQYNHFCKNLAIMGGVLALYLTGAGRFSLDNWMRNR